jgi:DNA-directed RNA polymerase specialized sigma24 family protein
VRAELEAHEFEDACVDEPALAWLTLADLIEFGRWTNTRQHEQDDVWLAVIRCWRQRDARLWGPVLLQMLAPALINETYRLALAEPLIDPVDVQQHLVTEVLAAATSLPLEDGTRRVRARLLWSAASRVTDWIRQTTDRQPLSLEQWRNRRLAMKTVNAEEARWRVAELRASRLAASDLELVIRMAVLGQDRHEVSRELGVSPSSVRKRYARARRRLRGLLAA